MLSLYIFLYQKFGSIPQPLPANEAQPSAQKEKWLGWASAIIAVLADRRVEPTMKTTTTTTKQLQEQQQQQHQHKQQKQQ